MAVHLVLLVHALIFPNKQTKQGKGQIQGSAGSKETLKTQDTANN